MWFHTGLGIVRRAKVFKVLGALTQDVPVDLDKRALIGLNLEQRSVVTVSVISLDSKEQQRGNLLGRWSLDVANVREFPVVERW